MKLVYVTDIHGNEAKFLRVLGAAKEKDAAAVINGGDMLCLDDDLHRTQKEFIEGFLDNHFAEYEKAGIFHLGYLGNDDLRIHDACFDGICAKHGHAINLAQMMFELGGFEFIGMNWVADYPFRLKDRCRKDRKDFVFERQLGSGLLSAEEGFKELSDWPAYVSTLPAIEQEIESLPKPKDTRKAVYVIHMPPARVGLDVCSDGREIGSQAIYGFIERTQPLLTLHGHIHESPSRSGVWRADIGETVCVQPGQLRAHTLSYALIDLETMRMERFEEVLTRSGIS